MKERKEEKLYDLIQSGGLSRAAAIVLIRSYGDQRVDEALAVNDSTEIKTRLLVCIEKLDQILQEQPV